MNIAVMYAEKLEIHQKKIMIRNIPYTYKFSRDINFTDFVVSWPSAKFPSSKIHDV